MKKNNFVKDLFITLHYTFILTFMLIAFQIYLNATFESVTMWCMNFAIICCFEMSFMYFLKLTLPVSKLYLCFDERKKKENENYFSM